MAKSKSGHAVYQCECEACKRHPTGKVAKEHRSINRVIATLDEKARRRFAGLLSSQRGYGGTSTISRITGLSRTTIQKGQTEIRRLDRNQQIRRSGSGRPAIEKKILAF